jgi:regulator of sirC expression with transglutaminase-like and TPR domain
MLHNLRSLAGRSRDFAALLRYLDAILTITPDSAEDRMYRAFYRYQNGQGRLALDDIDWLLAHEPPGIDLERVAQLRAVLARNSLEFRQIIGRMEDRCSKKPACDKGGAFVPAEPVRAA